MSLPDHYLMTVALHAVVLSLVVFLAVLCLRKPQRVALTALCGVLAIAILPWFSALRPWRSGVREDAQAPGIAKVASLPEWTVVRIPAVSAATAKTPTEATKSLSPARPDAETLGGMIWAGGSLFALCALVVAAARVTRWRRTLAEPDEAEWQAIVNAVQVAPTRPHFRISRSGGSPCVAGFFKPLVVIPSFLLDVAKRRELRWALRHELRHWRGRDSRWTVILEMARVMQWWNPFVHLLISRWKMAREHVCDLAATDEDRVTYGEFLIAMAAEPAPRNSLAVMMVRRQRLSTLRTRIVAVLNAAPGSATPFEKGVLFSACLALIGAALMVSGVRIGNEGMASVDAPLHLIGSAFGKDEAPDSLQGIDPEMVAQVKIQTKIIMCEADEVKDGGILTEEELLKLMRRFAQTKGTQLMTTPSVTVRTSEVSMIELLSEHPDDPPWIHDFERPQLRENRYVGWSLRVAAPYDGEKLAFTADIGCGYIKGSFFEEQSEALRSDKERPVAWDKLVRKNVSGRGRLGPGETLAINLGELEPGCFACVFMTVSPIDGTGLPVESFGKALHSLPKALEGKVKVHATVLERENFPGLDMPENLNEAYYSTFITKAQWEDMKENLEVEEPATLGLSPDEWARIDGVEGLVFSGEWFKIGNRRQPRLYYDLDAIEGASRMALPTRSLDSLPERVEIFRLRSEKKGMTRLLFIQVEELPE